MSSSFKYSPWLETSLPFNAIIFLLLLWILPQIIGKSPPLCSGNVTYVTPSLQELQASCIAQVHAGLGIYLDALGSYSRFPHHAWHLVCFSGLPPSCWLTYRFLCLCGHKLHWWTHYPHFPCFRKPLCIWPHRIVLQRACHPIWHKSSLPTLLSLSSAWPGDYFAVVIFYWIRRNTNLSMCSSTILSNSTQL